MAKVNYKSDFDFVLTLKDENGNDIGFPDFDFRIVLYTSSRASVYKAGCRNGECYNLYNDNGKIHVVCDSHNLFAGKLTMDLTYYIPNDIYPDKSQKIAMPSETLDIELVSDVVQCETPEVCVTLPCIQLQGNKPQNNYELPFLFHYKENGFEELPGKVYLRVFFGCGTSKVFFRDGEVIPPEYGGYNVYSEEKGKVIANPDKLFVCRGNTYRIWKNKLINVAAEKGGKKVYHPYIPVLGNTIPGHRYMDNGSLKMRIRLTKEKPEFVLETEDIFFETVLSKGEKSGIDLWPMSDFVINEKVNGNYQDSSPYYNVEAGNINISFHNLEKLKDYLTVYKDGTRLVMKYTGDFGMIQRLQCVTINLRIFVNHEDERSNGGNSMWTMRVDDAGRRIYYRVKETYPAPADTVISNSVLKKLVHPLPRIHGRLHPKFQIFFDRHYEIEVWDCRISMIPVGVPVQGRRFKTKKWTWRGFKRKYRQFAINLRRIKLFFRVRHKCLRGHHYSWQYFKMAYNFNDYQISRIYRCGGYLRIREY